MFSNNSTSKLQTGIKKNPANSKTVRNSQVWLRMPKSAKFWQNQKKITESEKRGKVIPKTCRNHTMVNASKTIHDTQSLFEKHTEDFRFSPA